MKLSQLPLLLLAAATTTLAQDWHFVAFTTPDGQEFISQSGNMIVPAIHEAATNYLWPGLQSTDNSGVYQNVLDGRSGGWWFGSGWCCSNPSLPWGGGFGAAEGDVLFFNNTRNTDRSEWVSVIEKNCGEASATNSFPIARHGLHNHHPDCPNHRPAGDINEDMIAHAGAMLLMANGRFQEMLEEVFGFRLQ
ncbi:hypothetical protein D6D18_09671 [Aureobasidium pullulans]|nr:hypothetical protein D6D18_09671 [Aureobasidium pullulans]